MTNREKLTVMYEYALDCAYCHNRKTFAAFVGVNANNLSNAFSDSLHERYCTNGLLNKANAALGYVFSQEWIQDGTGEMYARAQEHAASTAITQIPSAEDKPMISRNNDRMIDHLEYTIEVQKKLIEKLERENDALKKANTSVSAHVKHA